MPISFQRCAELLRFKRGIKFFSRIGFINEDKEVVRNLWPVWIKEYSDLKSWRDARAYERRMSLGEMYVFPVVGDKKPADISIDDVVESLSLAVNATNLTQQKVLTVMSQFLRWCDSKNLRDSTQRLPTEKALLEPFFGLKLKGRQGHYPAIDWRDVPRFVSKLQQSNCHSSKALLFTILTASRGQPVRFAKWSEIDFRFAEWHVPAGHMKGKQGNNRPHDVPLSIQALDLLSALCVERGAKDRIFAAGETPLSDTSLRKCIWRINRDAEEAGEVGFRDPAQMNRVVVPHGFRAAFATWAQENDKDMSLVERCLAHKDSADKHNGAYRRGVQVRQRRILLQEWADFCFSYDEDKNESMIL